MKKTLAIISSIFIFLMMLAQAVGPISVHAESNTEKYADGEYDLPFVVWQADKNETSVADGYLKKPAKLIVKEGEYTVQATLNNNSWWQYFKTETASSTFTDVEKINEDKAADTSLVQFKVKDIDQILNAKIHVIINGLPGLPDFKYDNKYDIRFNFDTSKIPLAPEPQPEPEQPQPEAINLADGNYTIGFAALHATEEKASAMARYLNSPAKVSVEGGKYSLTIAINDHKTVTGLQIEGKQPAKVNPNEAANTREVTYELDSLNDMMVAQVQYTSGGHNGDQPLRLSFDKNSVQEMVVEEPEPETIDLKDGNYTIGFAALHATEEKASAMAKYLDNPAKLSVKGGKYNLTITINDHKTVTGFQVEGEQPAKVNPNEAANTREATFELDSLQAMMKAQVQYTVGAHNGDQPLRLSFDKNSVEEMVVEEPESETIDLKDGNYTIGFAALHATEEKASAMAKYLDNPAKLSVKGGKYNLTITINDHKTVTGFQVEGEQPAKVNPNEAANTREATFELDSLQAMMNAQVQYTVGAHNGDQPLRLSFDKDSVKADGEEDPEEEDPKENPKDKDPELQDGKYTISFTLDGATEEEQRIADKYLGSSASVTVEGNKKRVMLTLKEEQSIRSFKVEQNGEFIEAEVLKVDESTGTKIISFEVDKLISNIKIKMEIQEQPAAERLMSFAAYNLLNAGDDSIVEYAFNLSFDVDNIKLVEEEEETPKPGDGNTESKYAEGEYDLPFNVLQDKTDDSSVTNNYLISPGKLIVANGKHLVQITLKNSSWWEYLKVQTDQSGSFADNNFVDVTTLSENKKEDTRLVQFEVPDLDKLLNAKVHVIVKGIPGFEYDNKYDIRIKFDTEKIPLVSGEDPKGEDPKEEDPKGEDPKGEKPDPTIDPHNLKDGQYSIEYKVLKYKTNQTSVMNDYIITPATLTVKGGKMFAAITLKNSSWITELLTTKGGKLVAPKVLSTNDQADTRVVEFAVEDLFERLDGRVSVDIPTLNYKETYMVQFLFDPTTIKLLNGQKDPKDDNVDDDSDKDPNKNPVVDDDDDLDFDRDSDKNDNKQGNNDKNKSKNDVKNPKTNDKAKIALFLSLLIGSLIPLVLKMRRRFI